jgi:hypothetical protein
VHNWQLNYLDSEKKIEILRNNCSGGSRYVDVHWGEGKYRNQVASSAGWGQGFGQHRERERDRLIGENEKCLIGFKWRREGKARGARSTTIKSKGGSKGV